MEVHDAHFPPGTTDTVWVPEVARRGWVVLSKDLSIASNTLERDTLFESGVRAFLLSQQDLSGPDQVTAFLKGLPDPQHRAQRTAALYRARVAFWRGEGADRPQARVAAQPPHSAAEGRRVGVAIRNRVPPVAWPDAPEETPCCRLTVRP